MSNFIRIAVAEVRREFKRAQAYWIEVLGDQVLFTLGFLLLSGLFHLVAEGNFKPEAQMAALVGFLTWRVADGCILRTVGSISQDAHAGTLEQVWLSGVSPHYVLMARSLAIFLYHSGRGLLLALVLIPILSLSFDLPLGVLLVFSITQAGVFGVAFIIAGLHLVYKNISSVSVAVSTALLFLTGALAPLDNTSPFYYALSRALPLTIGIDLSRLILVESMTLLALVQQPEFYWLLLNSVSYGLAGWLLFSWGQRTARRDGSLAHY